MTDEKKKIIESFKRYINFLNNTLDDYYKLMDDEFYKDQIEQLELSLKLCNKILNLTQNQQKEIEQLKSTISVANKLEDVIKNRYISKSKIEGKIDELECCLDSCVNDRKISKYKIKALEEEIKDFKELLESE